MNITAPSNPNFTGVMERFYYTIIKIYRCAKYGQKCTDVASIITYSTVVQPHNSHEYYYNYTTLRL